MGVTINFFRIFGSAFTVGASAAKTGKMGFLGGAVGRNRLTGSGIRICSSCLCCSLTISSSIFSSATSSSTRLGAGAYCGSGTTRSTFWTATTWSTALTGLIGLVVGRRKYECLAHLQTLGSTSACRPATWTTEQNITRPYRFSTTGASAPVDGRLKPPTHARISSPHESARLSMTASLATVSALYFSLLLKYSVFWPGMYPSSDSLSEPISAS